MSKPPKLDFKAIVAGTVPAAESAAVEPEREREVVRMRPTRAPAAGKGTTLKERAHQLSVYLEAPVYEKLRDVAHAERAKLHALVLEGIDHVLRKRGQPSIRQLMK